MIRDWTVWIKAAGIRAIKTAAQTFVALLPAQATIAEVDWRVVGNSSPGSDCQPGYIPRWSAGG